ncbi:efflux RND transporter permease subunit [Billgrantia ethanolica]|uniref:Efflux RND transporter permease subunit n=1 Tax=Billgrantia ethanolica TaxID=2733486 RepID=A0ABS9A5H4_9GAMM|nr:efflux RND transporter permease subunit [Halomonas ethanolica]MCE8004092.1 efflux RND transporter permease subunit [Halomonas ethanolica]
MDIARTAIDRPVQTWLIILACLLGGLWAMLTLGRLEDPSFTLKTAIITTPYPGANAEQVEQEVTERLESAIQQLPAVDYVRSRSRPGISEVEVEIKRAYPSRNMPQLWDELRRKIGDAQASLPPGAGPSLVNDDFGDVYGIYYAITAPELSDAEIRDLSRFLRRELLTVNGVAKVTTAGERSEALYVDLDSERLASLSVPLEQMIETLRAASAIAESGAITLDERRLRIAFSQQLASPAHLEELRIGRPGTTEQISLGDIATIRRSATELPDHLIRFNGMPAFTLAVAGVADVNIVEVGQAVDARLHELQERIPLGVELHPIYEQHRVVDDAIGSFLVNLALAVAIVIGVLCLFMGWRAGLVVGATLLLTVLGTLLFMRVLGLEMERISLGALIIAMGMLVDNAIVVTEGMLIGMQRGANARDAASTAAKRTQVPLLGATVIGIMAFAGIGLSPDTTGDLLFSLFAVIAVSLLLSWVLAITVTPLLGHYLLKTVHDAKMPYTGRLYRGYRRLLEGVLRWRLLTLLSLILFTAGCIFAFGFVKQAFFPASNTPIFFLHYQLPQGTDIRATDRHMQGLDDFLRAQPEVLSVTQFVGRGASRFVLTYTPERPSSSYGLFMIRTAERDQIDPLAARLRQRLDVHHPDAQARIERLMFGPNVVSIEARFSGPDPVMLRYLGDQAKAIMERDPLVTDIVDDWRQRELVLEPVFDEERARMAGVQRDAAMRALQFATTGIQAALYRENDRLLPIVLRPPEHERLDVTRLHERQLESANGNVPIPLRQIIERFDTISEESVIRRRDRMRTLTVQASTVSGVTASEGLSRIRAPIEAIPLPLGYRLEWGGEYEASGRSRASLRAQLPLGFLAMLVISVLLFGKWRQPLILWLVVPMSICGVVIGLLASGMPFTFTALLGLLSLSGMLMKNGIVLLDEIDAQIREGKPGCPAVVEASVSRLRPVVLAAGTTILGMLPLLGDAFFASMAATIMGGLAFATLLTLVAVPVLYALLFGIRPSPKRVRAGPKHSHAGQPS